jgi:hypothetical protein
MMVISQQSTLSHYISTVHCILSPVNRKNSEKLHFVLGASYNISYNYDIFTYNSVGFKFDLEIYMACQ